MEKKSHSLVTIFLTSFNLLQMYCKDCFFEKKLQCVSSQNLKINYLNLNQFPNKVTRLNPLYLVSESIC